MTQRCHCYLFPFADVLAYLWNNYIKISTFWTITSGMSLCDKYDDDVLSQLYSFKLKSIYFFILEWGNV